MATPTNSPESLDPQLDRRNLQYHLWPRGNLDNSSLLPDVIDSDGNIVNSTANKFTTVATVVDVGDSPSSNSGDPLRVAFIKLNNFIEASYWTNSAVVKDIDSVREEVRIIRVENDSDEQALQTIQETMDDRLYHPGAIAPLNPVNGTLWFYATDRELSMYNSDSDRWLVLGTVDKDPSNNKWQFRMDGGSY
jgi:hypothetical protein